MMNIEKVHNQEKILLKNQTVKYFLFYMSRLLNICKINLKKHKWSLDLREQDVTFCIFMHEIYIP